MRSPHYATSHGLSDTASSKIRNATQRYITSDLKGNFELTICVPVLYLFFYLSFLHVHLARAMVHFCKVVTEVIHK